MDSPIKSVLITRYNLERVKESSGQHLDPDWLDHRLALFSRFTAPSIARLTTKPDVWLILIHPDTPIDRKRQILSAAGPSGVARVRALHRHTPERSTEAREALVAEIRKIFGTEGIVLTTRLDNDDALAPWFYEKIFQAELVPGLAVNFKHGTGIATEFDEAFDYFFPASPFMSLVENLSDMKTISNCEHDELHRSFDVVDIETKEAMWIEVFHDRNLVNQLPGPVVHALKKASERQQI